MVPEKNPSEMTSSPLSPEDEAKLQSPVEQQSSSSQSKPKRPRGLAAASPETRKAVARKGGEAVSKNRGHMSSIGRKGGVAVSQDRRHMAEIGRKGGTAVSQNREHMAEIGRKGGEARSHHKDESGSGSEGEESV